MKRMIAGRVIMIFCILCFITSPSAGATKAYDPAPTDGAGSVPLQPVFSWEYEGDSCNVYAGISPQDLRLVISYSTMTWIESPQKLPFDTVFFWRVDVNSGDQVLEGDLWSFRTESLSESVGCSSTKGVSFSQVLILLPLITLFNLLPRN